MSIGAAIKTTAGDLLRGRASWRPALPIMSGYVRACVSLHVNAGGGWWMVVHAAGGSGCLIAVRAVRLAGFVLFILTHLSIPRSHSVYMSTYLTANGVEAYCTEHGIDYKSA